MSGGCREGGLAIRNSAVAWLTVSALAHFRQRQGRWSDDRKRRSKSSNWMGVLQAGQVHMEAMTKTLVLAAWIALSKWRHLQRLEDFFQREIHHLPCLLFGLGDRDMGGSECRPTYPRRHRRTLVLLQAATQVA